MPAQERKRVSTRASVAHLLVATSESSRIFGSAVVETVDQE